jgi:hemolysin III
MEVEARIRGWKDPFSCLSHFVGFLAALVGLVYLLSITEPGTAKRASFLIYGISLPALLLSSSVYHFFIFKTESANRWLRRMDHAVIYVLIAGTCIPIEMHLLDGNLRVIMLVVIGVLSVAGIVMKLLWIDCPRWLSAGLYIATGWAAVAPGHIMFPKLDTTGITLLIAGGLTYSIGAVIYALKRPDPWPERFGFHEIWHLFVLGGAGAHFAFVASLRDVPCPPF